MTREEAIERVQATVIYMESLDADEEELKDLEAYRIAIKALEQEPVLDKIRAEITDAEKCWYGVNDCFVKLSDVLKILDKYKAESEGKE